MAVSKVILNGETLMDVTVDTVTSENLLSGYQATRRDGQKIEGSYVPQSAELIAGSTNPSESAQHITPPSGYDGFEYFDVGAIDSNYVGSNVPARDTNDLSASGSVVTVPSGYYATAASTAIAAGAVSIEDQELTLDPSISVSSSGNISFYKGYGKFIYPSVTSGYISSVPMFYIHASAQSSYQLDTQAAATITPSESTQIAVDSGKFTTGVVNVAAISSDYVGSNISQRDTSDLSASGSVITVPSGYYAAEASKAVSAGSATTPTKTITANPSISVNTSTGLITATAAGSSSITPTVSAGYVSSGTAGTVSISGTNTLQLSTQTTKTVTPTESEQTAVTANKYTTGIVKVAAIPSDYIGSAIASVDVIEGTTIVSGTTATRGVATWSAGVISSGQINAATFANSSSAQAQYVDISNTTDAPVLVSGGYLYINKGYTDDLKISLAKLVPDGASADLASGVILSGYAAYNNDGALIAGNIPSKSSTDITASGSTVSVPSGYYASSVNKNVSSGTAKVNNTDLIRTPGLILDNTVGIVTATIPYSQTNVGAALSTGYISTVATGSIGVTGSSSLQLSVVSGSTITPTESTQIAVASGSYTLGDVKIAAISSDYVGSNIVQRSSSDLSATGSVVTVPSGYYSSEESKAIPAGSAQTPGVTITTNPTISIDSSGTITASNSKASYITPVVNAGYVSSGTSGIITITGYSVSQLSTQAATTITPIESIQTAVASGKYTLGDVKVAAISSTYIGSGIAQKSSSDLIVNNSVVTAPAGYYSADASTTIAAGSFTVAPVLTTPPIGTVSIDSSTGVITVARSSQTWSNVIKANATQAGYISANTSSKNDLTIGASSKTYALSTIAGVIITPSESAQLAAASGKYTLGDITVAAISSDYIGSAVPQRSSSDLSTSGAVVSVPSGYYAAAASAEVQSGSVTVSTLTSTVTPTISLNSSTGLITATNNTSISVGAALTSGYVVSVTSGTVYSEGSQTLQLTTKAAATYTPGTASQTIAAGQYLTGVQTIAGDTNLIAENIVTGITLFGVSGTAPVYEFMTTEEIWEATESGWGSTSPSYAAAIWSSVAAGWSVSSTITEAQISASVELGWR